MAQTQVEAVKKEKSKRQMKRERKLMMEKEEELQKQNANLQTVTVNTVPSTIGNSSEQVDNSGVKAERIETGVSEVQIKSIIDTPMDRMEIDAPRKPKKTLADIIKRRNLRKVPRLYPTQKVQKRKTNDNENKQQ